MAYIAPAIANTAQKIELSTIQVAGPAQVGTLELNALLVSRTLIAAAKQKAGFIQPKPSAPMVMYMLPDGSLTTNKAWRQDYDTTGFAGNE
ncbi:hypothetical protein [Hymenobacter siberiensis]|uniref:hypothetical protein n=1 Tax=Hymenobacter siberiensis TaxID=2848396 RepID=UPI001C1DCEDD|nr:hypothetical protein [Hymenobacter siberiensis]